MPPSARDHQQRSTPGRRRASTVVALAAVTALLASCSSGGGASDEDQVDVPLGATMEEYQAALADIDPIELRMNANGSPGNPYAATTEKYAEALEEWSGGKITVNIGYANSFADADEMSTAMADGRLTAGSITPALEPDKFANWAKLQELSFMHQRTPIVGTLQLFGAMAEVSWTDEAIIKEFQQAGLEPLVPYIPTSPLPVMTCSKPGVTTLAKLKGKSARVGSANHAVEAEAIGVSPNSLPFDETYEALQRGTIDCVISGIEFLGAAGSAEVAPYMTLNAEGGFTAFGSALVVGKAQFDKMPLAARQLIFDRTDVLLKATIDDTVMGQTANGLDLIAENGGDVSALDDATIKKLGAHQDEVRKAADPDVVAQVEKAHAAWLSTVEELGYEDGGDAVSMADWYSVEKYDLTPFIEKIMEGVNEHRPGA